MDKNISQVKAINKNVRTSPRKLALVCNFIISSIFKNL